MPFSSRWKPEESVERAPSVPGADALQQVPYRQGCQAADQARPIARQGKAEHGVPQQGGKIARPQHHQNGDEQPLPERQVLAGHGHPPDLLVRAAQAILDRIVVGWNRIARSEEHTSELQSLMRITYAVLCLKKK